MSNYAFSVWKWRALCHRRLFFFVALQFVLIFCWLNIRQIVRDEDEFWSEGDTGYRKFYKDVPVLFYITHAIFAGFVLFTQFGRKFINESQGRRICEWCAISLVIALIFLIVPMNRFNEGDKANNRNFTFVLVSVLGIAIFQHLGISNPLLSITTYSILILWVVLLCYVVSLLPIIAYFSALILMKKCLHDCFCM
jgi:hypothetical protein